VQRRAELDSGAWVGRERGGGCQHACCEGQRKPMSVRYLHDSLQEVGLESVGGISRRW
jgi:hypothetical protein